MQTLDFEEGFVEKLKEIRAKDLLESNYKGTSVLLELLSFLGYEKVVAEFIELNRKGPGRSRTRS